MLLQKIPEGQISRIHREQRLLPLTGVQGENLHPSLPGWRTCNFKYREHVRRYLVLASLGVDIKIRLPSQFPTTGPMDAMEWAFRSKDASPPNIVIFVAAFKYYNKQNILLFFGSISITIFILGTTLLFSNIKINSTILNFNSLDGFDVIFGRFFYFLFFKISKKYIILFINSIILIAIYLSINNKINNKNYSEELSFWCILILPISIIFALLSESSHDENNV